MRIHKYINRLLGYTALVFFVLWGVNLSGARAEMVDRIVAVVNEDIVSLTELNEAMAPYVEKIKTAGYPAEKEQAMLYKVREDMLNQLIDQRLTDQETRRARISVSEKEVDGALDRIRQSQMYSEEEMKAALEQEGMTLEEYRKRMKEQILRTKLVNMEVKSKIIITEDDVKKYYDEHADEFQTEKTLQLRNILMEVLPFAQEPEKAAVKKRMEDVAAKLKSGASFADMAKKYSESTLAKDGGKLGTFVFSDLAPVLQEALADLKEGEVSDIIDTEQGYQIFFIEKITRSQGKSLKEASPDIQEKLFSEIVRQKFGEWLADLRKRSHIKIVP